MSGPFADWVWPILRAAAMLGAGWYAGRWLRAPLNRFLEGRIEPTLRAFLVTAVHPVVVCLAVPPALEALHVSMSSALAVLSTAGLAIALALRDSLSNVASGALLLTARPFLVGDLVTLAGVTGRVRRVGLLLVEIDTEDGRRVSVTNDKVLAVPMEKHAADGTGRVEIVVRVPAARVDDDLLERMGVAARAVGGSSAEVVPVEVEVGAVRLAVRAWLPSAAAAETRRRLFLAVWSVARPSAEEPPPREEHR